MSNPSKIAHCVSTGHTVITKLYITNFMSAHCQSLAKKHNDRAQNIFINSNEGFLANKTTAKWWKTISQERASFLSFVLKV